MTAEALPAAAILAGGFGTRIRPVGGDVPKVLLPVEGRPFIAHLLEYLAREGATRAVLCLGHAADAVEETARRHAPPGLALDASRETEPLGTGGALVLARPRLGARFFVVNGDTFLDAPLAALLRVHTAGRALLTLTLVRSERAAEKGSVRAAADGRVLAFDEKTGERTGLVNGGVYVAEAALLDGATPGRPASLEREIIPGALARGATVLSVTADAPFTDIGLPDDYFAVRERLPRRAPAGEGDRR